jgi:aspartate/methionine/tyrosine aminotransferase
MKIATRAIDFRSFIVMDVLERANALERAGQDIIHLEIGEPDFDTPQCIREAGIKAIREGKTHYTHSLGILELREAICHCYMHKYGVHINPEQVIVTSGTSPAMLLIFSALLGRKRSPKRYPPRPRQSL